MIHDLLSAIKAGIAKWRECRYMRSGGNPDVLPF